MKYTHLPWLLLLLLVACHRDEPEAVQPDYPDWYAIKSPEASAIRAVYGDIDGTLLITTGFKIYRTTDRGKTWRTGDYKANIGIFGFTASQDSVFLLTGGTSSSLEPLAMYGIHPHYYSTDQGLTWQSRRWTLAQDTVRVPLNRVKSPSGIDYSIDRKLTLKDSTSPANVSYWVETVGVKTSTGRKISLPQSHQLESLYMDSKARLYVAASAPLCGRLADFSFCGDQNGILYVSKRAQD